MTNNGNEKKVICPIAKQRTTVSGLGVLGMGDCEGGCQINPRGGRAHVVDEHVEQCSDGKKISNPEPLPTSIIDRMATIE